MTASQTDYPMPKGLDFPEPLTLAGLQQHAVAICDYYKFTKDDGQIFLLLMEEIGELAKAIRKIKRLHEEKNNPSKPSLSEEQRRDNLGDEFADVMAYLFDLANRFDIDLDAAYRKKMSDNTKRQWD